MRRQATKGVSFTNYFHGLFKVHNYITFLVETTSLGLQTTLCAFPTTEKNFLLLCCTYNVKGVCVPYAPGAYYGEPDYTVAPGLGPPLHTRQSS